LKQAVEIITCVKEHDKLEELISEYKNVHIADSYEDLKQILSNHDEITPRIAIVDTQYLINKNGFICATIRDDLMYKAASLVAYGENISHTINQQLYALDFKGIIDVGLQNNENVLNHVVKRSFFYASTFHNNFTKAFIDCNELNQLGVRELTYLFDYLVEYYKISAEDAFNIRIVFVSLLAAFKQNNITRFEKMLKTIFKSDEKDSLYKSIYNPQEFNQKIIAMILFINSKKNPLIYADKINFFNIDEELYNEIEDIYRKKTTTITSNQGINFFWEQLSEFTLKKYMQDRSGILDDFLENILLFLQKTLSVSNFMRVSIIDENVEVTKIILEVDTKIIKEELLLATKNIEIEFNENNITLIFTKELYVAQEKQEQKTSAMEFLEDYQVDKDLLDDLSDNEKDVKNLLFMEDLLSETILESVYILIEKYIEVLNRAYVFDNLTFALDALSMIFSSLNIETLDDQKLEILKAYIQGFINDLECWKQSIFIDANTPDIHYLDASLLENCSLIKRVIYNEDIEEDAGELEFF